VDFVRFNIVTVDQYLYVHGFPRRRLKRGASFVVMFIAIFVLGGLFTILLGFYGPKLIPPAIQSSVQELTALGAWLKLSSDFATIIVAEVIAIGGMSIIARMFRGKREPIGPNLWLEAKLPVTDKEGVKHYKVVVSNERGNRSAISCQARIIFSEVEKRDVLPLRTAKLNSDNFTATIKADLCWDDGTREYTLRSGDETEIEVLRRVPAIDRIEEHFEIPSCDTGWNALVGFRLKPFYPKLRIIPFNGRHVTSDLTLYYGTPSGNSDSRIPKDWLLS
jgi:hypothetical protein